jgi:putative phage-type endonuclease
MSIQTAKSIDKREMSYEQWIAERRKAIGGSDAASLLGLNSYKSPIRLYMEKIGEIEPEPAGEAARWGNILEDIVAKEFSRVTGKKAHNVNKILIHPEYDWMIANIDRRIVGENAILECKTTSAYNKDKWEGDEIPQEYIIQVMHYMAVTGAEKAYFACLIGGQKFVWKEIERDEELIELLTEQEKDFWENHVMKGIPPELDGSDDSKELLLKMYPEDSDPETIELDQEADVLLCQLDEVKKTIKTLNTQKTEYENKVKRMVGEHGKAITEHYRISWPTSKPTFDPKAFKKDHPSLYEQYKIKPGTRRFTFKEAK